LFLKNYFILIKCLDFGAFLFVSFFQLIYYVFGVLGVIQLLMVVSLMLQLRQVVKLLSKLHILVFELFRQASDFLFERFLLLLDGSYHVLLEVINSLVESREIAFDGLRVGSEHSEHFADLLTQSAFHLFGYVSIKPAKHGFDHHLRAWARQLCLNLDKRIKDSSYLLLFNERVTRYKAVIF
jgi:hypothetical protein